MNLGAASGGFTTLYAANAVMVPPEETSGLRHTGGHRISELYEVAFSLANCSGA